MFRANIWMKTEERKYLCDSLIISIETAVICWYDLLRCE
jgi:hypothetical protein